MVSCPSKFLLLTQLGAPSNVAYFSIQCRQKLKLRCDERFTHAFTACGCIFKEITLVGSNQGNYFENGDACSKRMRKTTVATQL